MNKTVAVVLSLVFLAACIQDTAENPVSSNGSVEVYFCPEDRCMDRLISLINSSSEVKCAFYDLDLPEVISLLKEKNADVVIEDSNRLAGFRTGYSKALMHNKFCIFDRKTVFTGSMNPTERDNYYNNNNIVIIDSEIIAKNYLDEFDELKNNVYGRGNKVKYPVVRIGNITVENYFCPEDNCKLHVLNALRSAEHSVYFMTFSFTDPDIGNLLYNDKYLGMSVMGIFEKGQLDDSSRYYDLRDFSILDRNTYNMHHKVFVIDNRTVITGSFNPSRNANEFNDENVIIIHDPAVAEQFSGEFSRLWSIDYDSLPETPGSIVISKVQYNPLGNDDAEYLELTDISGSAVDLGNYEISDNKTNMRLSGMILPNTTVRIKPKFALTNKQGILILKRNLIPVDYVSWSPGKNYAAEGYILYRASPAIGSWEVKQ